MSTTNTPPVRFGSGVSTSAGQAGDPNFLFGNLPFPTPPRLNQYFSDFDTYLSGEWTVTTGSTGSVGLTDGNGGLLLISSAGATNDIQAMQLVPKSFALAAGSQAWFACNISLSSATLPLVQFGLANTHATPGTTTDGVFFTKAAASSTMQFTVRGSSTSTTATVGTVVAATAYTFGFYYNGRNSPNDALLVYSTIGQTAANGYVTPGNGAWYFNGGNYIATSFGSGYTNSLANLPSANLTAGIAIKASTGATVTATVDYFYMGGEIVSRY